ncbi:MAG: hypothetical protein NVSMB55_06020 [Mycobacteriales bacterium]
MIGAPAQAGGRQRRSAVAGAAALLLVALSSCGRSSAAPPSADGPAPTPSPTGAVSAARLRAMLLQPADLPGLSQRREYAGAGLTTQATPQLSLCHGTAEVAPHELANVISEVSRPGGVKVFEVLSVFADPAAAKAAYDADLAAARACTTYTSDGVAHRVTRLGPVPLEPGVQAIHYALVTSDIVSGDVRTYAWRGTTTVLVSGFGAPPTGQPLLDFQADVMRKALARLG